MPYQEFNTKWVNTPEELPPIGIECPACQKGFPEDNSFEAKDGHYFKSVKCITCRTKWIVSKGKGARKDAGAVNESDQGEIIIKGIRQILKNQVIIDTKLKRFIDHETSILISVFE